MLHSGAGGPSTERSQEEGEGKKHDLKEHIKGVKVRRFSHDS